MSAGPAGDQAEGKGPCAAEGGRGRGRALRTSGQKGSCNASPTRVTRTSALGLPPKRRAGTRVAAWLDCFRSEKSKICMLPSTW